MKTKARHRFTLVMAIAVCIVSAWGTLYFKSRADAMEQVVPNAVEPKLTVVDVYRVARKDHTHRFETRGAVEGIQEVTIAAEVQGPVVARPIRESQVVDQGEVLCEIDTTFYEHAVDAAKAQLAEARTALADGEEFLEHLDSLSTEQRLPLEHSRAVNARDRAEATVESAHAQLAEANERLRRCTIRSPIRGVVSAVWFEVGELLQPSQPVAEVVRQDRMKLLVDLTEIEAAQLGTEPRIVVSAPGLPGARFYGRLGAVYPKANPQTRRTPVEIWIENPERQLRSGMFVNCTIESLSATPRLVVPARAVLHDFGSKHCYVAKPKGDEVVVHRQSVHAIPIAGSVSLIEVIQGLEEGDLIILNKQREIETGERVATRTVNLNGESIAGTP